MTSKTYQLTKSAEESMVEIYHYGLIQFGPNIADSYYDGLVRTFDLLANMPQMGRECFGYRRHEHKSHVIIYLIEQDRILIVEILHKSSNIISRLKHLEI